MPTQIGAFVQGLTARGDARWSEGQVAAFAMAVLLKGMGRDECVALTRAMVHSGDALDWSRAGLWRSRSSTSTPLAGLATRSA
jgi:thymidine phosphorylase